MLADPLPAEHPLRSARWIWPRHPGTGSHAELYLHNLHAQFRHVFELADVPERAPLFITADKAYKLWVNGRYVCRGPARGYQQHWPFDEVDLAAVLQTGRNLIAVEAYNPGCNTFQYLFQTQARLICAARWGATQIASGAGWQMRRSSAHRRATARLSVQMDYQEHVDLARLEPDWRDDPDADFAGAQEGPGQALSFENACYQSVEPRGIPLLAERLCAPQVASVHGRGPCLPEYRTTSNLYQHYLAEHPGIVWTAAAVDQQRRDDGLHLEIPAPRDGELSAVAIELDEYRVGTVQIAVDGADGGELVDILADEDLVDSRPPRRAVNCELALGMRLALRPGHNEHEFFHLVSGRLLTVLLRDARKPLRLRVSFRSAGYPFAMRGSFASSDAELDGIHDICRRTQQLCALDAYVDTPWREQAQWWGDARVQARNTFYLDGDARLFARGIRQIAQQAGPYGLTYGHAPTGAYNCVLLDFLLTWIVTCYDHWWQTGETALAREQLPRIREVLGYFHSERARGPHGLLCSDPSFWLFEDWSTLYKGRVPTFLNLWYLYALRHLVVLLRALDEPGEADAIASEAEQHQALLLDTLVDPTSGMFCHGLDDDGAPVAGGSVHDQCLALLLDLLPDAHGRMLDHYLLPYLRGDELDCPVPSAFWATYALEAAIAHGRQHEALTCIRERWRPMLATGTTWEIFDWGEDGGWTASHAWSAHPSYHLVDLLCGTRQLAPAWRRIRLEPCFVDELEHVQARIPAPPGDIVCGWRREDGKLHYDFELPDGVEAELALPGAAVERIVGPTRDSRSVAPAAIA